jgi:hypothetical protein
VQSAAFDLQADLDILEADPAFRSSQECGGRWSTCDGEEEGDTSDDDDDASMAGGGLDAILQWPPELLHRPPPNNHRKKARRSEARVGWSGVEEGQGARMTTAGTSVGSVGAGEWAGVGQPDVAGSEFDVGARPSWAAREPNPRLREGPTAGSGFEGRGWGEGSEGPAEVGPGFEGGGWNEGSEDPGDTCAGSEAGPGWGWLNMDAAHDGLQEHYVIPPTTGLDAEPRKKRVRLPTAVTQLSTGLGSSIAEYETDLEDDADNENVNCDGIKHMFRDETWSQNNFTYDPPRMAFSGRQGTTRTFHRMPTMLALWELFWPYNILRKIVEETNRYARHVKSDGSTEGGPKWKDITVACLKAFIVVHIYMGMKREPNIKAYWHREGSLFHCPIISNIMTWERFREIRRCLHITNPATYEHIEKGQLGYDKVRQTRWLVEEIRKACMREWSLVKFLTIDEMMIRYKGSYCPTRQYMPKKPEKWGIKVWCLADLSSKFVYNFDIYYGKNVETEVRVVVPRGEASLAHAIVMKLLQGLENKGHYIVMDNYFSSIGLFKELALNGTYAIGTIRSNRVGLPSNLRNLKSWKEVNRGTWSGQCMMVEI